MTRASSQAACKQCGQLLGTETWADASVRYIHTGPEPAGHAPEPVPPGELDEVISRCDFCNAVAPGWIVPVLSFRSVTGPHRPAFDSDSDWAACDRCAGYVTRRQWDQLIRYGLRGASAGAATWPELNKEAMDDARAFYRAMEASMTGPPVRKP